MRPMMMPRRRRQQPPALSNISTRKIRPEKEYRILAFDLNVDLSLRPNRRPQGPQLRKDELLDDPAKRVQMTQKDVLSLRTGSKQSVAEILGETRTSLSGPSMQDRWWIAFGDSRRWKLSPLL
jgi:hypothetical protein